MSGQCPNSCNFNGDCVNGRCHCFLGFEGDDCGKRELLDLFVFSAVSNKISTLLESFCDLPFRPLNETSISGLCPNNCSSCGKCLSHGVCECENGYTGIDCSTGTLLFLEYFSSCNSNLNDELKCGTTMLPNFAECVLVICGGYEMM